MALAPFRSRRLGRRRLGRLALPPQQLLPLPLQVVPAPLLLQHQRLLLALPLLLSGLRLTLALQQRCLALGRSPLLLQQSALPLRLCGRTAAGCQMRGHNRAPARILGRRLLSLPGQRAGAVLRRRRRVFLVSTAGAGLQALHLPPRLQQLQAQAFGLVGGCGLLARLLLQAVDLRCVCGEGRGSVM